MKNHPHPELDKRKAFILATVVYEYIATAEPVGSQTLTQKYNLGVSSATVRNEMAELEALGFLVQPHTSSGRVPSDAGYRTYVDRLMKPEQLPIDEQRRIRDEFRRASHELDEIIEQTTRLLGRLSQRLAFVVAPSQETALFRHIQLIWLSPRTGLAVVVSSPRFAAQHVFELQSDVDPDALTRLSNVLNASLSGLTLRQIDRAKIEEAVRRCGLGDDAVGAVEAAFRSARHDEEPAVTAAGARNLLDQPEFHDLRKLRSILRIVEEQKTLYDLVAGAMTTDTPSVKIGHELGSDEMSECSLVTVPYRLAGGAVGMLAVLGPRRMPYGRLLALVSNTAESLTEHLADSRSA